MKKMTTIFSADLQTFCEHFSDADAVLRTFHPDNWPEFVKRQQRCFTAPRVSLTQIAEHYGEDTVAELVRQQFEGLQ